MKDYKPNAEEILDTLKQYYKESVFITDGEGFVVFANEIAAQQLGTTLDKILYQDVRALMKAGIYSRSTALEAIAQKKEVIGPLNPDRVDSTVSHSVPVMDADGKVTYVVTNNMGDIKFKEWEKVLNKEREAVRRIQSELEYLRENQKQDLVVQSPAMQMIQFKIQVAAPTDTSVVLYGESGTGKDAVVQQIHRLSKRSGHAFIRINCAAIPEQLLESELFGYEKGAFTGALAKGKIGLFEAAQQGTVFLDEIGELPLSLQPKLLRVLENRELRRVGGVEDIPVDIRIICATNQNLWELVKQKKFREDLYYRLNVFPITIPPLRERKEDIPVLAELFLRQLNEKYGTQKVLTSAGMRSAQAYNWPGNVRELRNVIERAYIISATDELDIHAAAIPDIEESVPLFACEDMQQFQGLRDYLHHVEQECVRRTLAACSGNVNLAAEKLGIHRSVLYKKLQQMK